jgi:hypothetical protein
LGTASAKALASRLAMALAMVSVMPLESKLVMASARVLETQSAST